MTDEANNWPLPKFNFSVDFGLGSSVRFQEVFGLDAPTDIIEYRAGNAKVFSSLKMPGIAKTGAVTLKKGVFASDNAFWDWYNETKMNVISRRTVTIQLLDEEAKPTMTWTLRNAWPTKITSSDLLSEGNEIAIETVEIVFESIDATNK